MHDDPKVWLTIALSVAGAALAMWGQHQVSQWRIRALEARVGKLEDRMIEVEKSEARNSAHTGGSR